MHVSTRLVIVVAGLAQFLVAFDASVTNIALRAIDDDLRFSATGLSWVINGYAVAFGGLLLLGGRLCDRWGTRRLLAGGFAVFVVASLLAYAATQPWMLVAIRVAQGAAAAAIAPAALTAVAVTFPSGKGRAAAFGVIAAGSAGGGALGLVLSGLVTDTFGWRTVVAMGAVVAGAGFAAALAGAPNQASSGVTVDWAGAILATAGLSLLTYAVVTGGERGWASAVTVGQFVLAAALLAGFVLIERRVRLPLVNFRVLRTRSVLTANVVMAVLVAGQFAAFYFISLYAQTVLGYSALQAGLAFVPFCAGLMVAIVAATKLLPVWGPRRIVVGGAVISTVGMLLFAPLPVDAGYWTALLPPCLVLSFGLGLAFVPLPNVGTAGLPTGDVGMASGMLNTSRQLGGSTGLAALVAVAATVTAQHTAADPVSATVSGYRAALVVASGLIAVAAAIATLLPAATAQPHAPAEAEGELTSATD